MAKEIQKGGKRVNAGRKPHSPPLRRIHLRITDEQAQLLRMWGKGDMSAGLRWLIEAAAPLVIKEETGKD